MKTLRIWVIVSLALGVISFVAFVLERMALTDIFNGEADVSLEWKIVNVALIPVMLFHISALVALGLLFGSLNQQGQQPKVSVK